jgi:NADP-dependent 3-hydroxy acid dehydrogenase YdfG
VRVTLICPAGTATEFAVGSGRVENDPRNSEWLTPEDVAAAIATTLQQPRSMRTAMWTLWSMGQGS